MNDSKGVHIILLMAYKPWKADMDLRLRATTLQ